MAPSIEEPLEIAPTKMGYNQSTTREAVSVGLETEAMSNRVVKADAASNLEAYTVLEEPLGTARLLRVITIGAGAGGLNLARNMELQMTNVDHIIYEKNPEVGGTWYENK